VAIWRDGNQRKSSGRDVRASRGILTLLLDPGDDFSATIATIYPHYDKGLLAETLAVLEAASVQQAIDYCMRFDGSASSSSTYLRDSVDVKVLCQMVTFESRGSGGGVHLLDTSCPRP
jgi:hypothetical protein